MSNMNIIPTGIKNDYLIYHSLNCTKQLGHCSVPGCGITKGIIEFLFGDSEYRKNNCVHFNKRNRQDSYESKKRKLTEIQIPNLIISYPPSPGDFIKKNVECILSSQTDPSYEYSHLLECLTNEQIKSYLETFKIRQLQSLYGPLLLQLIQHKENRDMFNIPVDPIKLNIPYYLNIIKIPMDFGTVRERLSSGFYIEAKDIERDMELVLTNAMSFNPKDNIVHIAAYKLHRLLKSELEKLHQKYEQMNQQQRNHICSSCNGTPCSLCNEKCIKYSPFVLVCDGPCRQKILRNSTYYLIRGYPGRYCHKCYLKVLNEFIKVDRKRYLIKKKNDMSVTEPWVQCKKCKQFLHASCGLLHIRQEDKNYICPNCLLSMPHRSLKSRQLASDLPCSPITDFLKQQLDQRVFTEYNKYYKEHHRSQDINAKEIQTIQNSLIIKLLSNIQLESQVKDCISPLYTENSNQSLSIPYTSKCIALFQNHNGCDVLLFVLYVYEYGMEPTVPIVNQRTAYISYLDSIHYLTPRYLRTPLYYEILQSYMYYCKLHGFIRTHIWACPPSRGDDYIFTHHPKDQRTPNARRLIDWYAEMLQEAKKRNILFDIRCQLDSLLESNTLYNMHLDPSHELHFKPNFCVNIKTAPVPTPSTTSTTTSTTLPIDMNEDDQCSVDTLHSASSTMTYSGNFTPSNPINSSTGSFSLAAYQSMNHNSSIVSDFSMNSSEYETDAYNEVDTDSTGSSLCLPVSSSSIISTVNNVLIHTSPSLYTSTNPSLYAPVSLSTLSSSTSIPSPSSDTNITSLHLLVSGSPVKLKAKSKSKSKTKPKQRSKPKSKTFKNTSFASPVPDGYISYEEQRLMKVLPYYEGDYWPYVCDGLLKDIYEDESKGKFNACLKNPHKPSPKSRTEQHDYDVYEGITHLPSEILRRYCRSMLENPSRFLIVYLYPYCIHCGETLNDNTSSSMTTKVYYHCIECSKGERPFYLCEHCYHSTIPHPMNHHLVPVTTSIPPFVPDTSPRISHEFIDKRSEFLKYCQGNFLQFDSMKHSILSTSLLLNCITHQPKDLYMDTCDGCENVLYTTKYTCKYCHTYNLCENCMKRDGRLHIYNHQHNLTLNTNTMYSDN